MDDGKLVKVVAFRLTESDFQDYKATFAASGLTQSEFFRRYVLTNATEVIAAPEPSLSAQKMEILFSRISNNVNQLARRANSDNLAGKVSDSTYIAVIESLEWLRGDLMKALQNVG